MLLRDGALGCGLGAREVRPFRSLPIFLAETTSSATNNDMSIVRTYVLPDFVPTSSNKLGYVRMPPTGETPPPEEPDDVPMEMDDRGKGKAKEGPQEEEQLLQMGNERFTVPEVDRKSVV